EGVSFAVQPDIPPRPAAPAGATAAPSAAARDFEATPVSKLVALANSAAVRPIRLADTSLGAQLVSGRFRVDDTELLARRLGALFGRGVDTGDPREIVLGPAGDGAAASTEAGRRHPMGGIGR
ncbi:MAG TPA: hypothetical protein VFQ52_00875, partial [Rhizomicrobium sp.]|nr:hypothetical protein [Rhizomicrobium sp.]